MPRITRVYTRTGDDGTTALATGERVPKDSLRVQVCGTIDELSSHVGVALAQRISGRLAPELRRIQNDLFHLGAELATPQAPGDAAPRGPVIEDRHAAALEQLMDALGEGLSPLENFVLPGGSPPAAQLHVARTVCRRAERELVRLAREEAVAGPNLRYLNRLSDALFVMARFENVEAGCTDVLWDSRA
ncbi:MAG TPA: cob(I)yrinic acid a,c-diamide adenosyltransferase [Thermoanaerobaculia bacterium]|nr:cob(I)yrinic acid a,c-diamide adenosyltransferase [Thermoanaerobaculia bacterium]